MKKVRASRTARSGPTASKRDTSRATSTRDRPNGASREPSHARLLDLQASGGNRAVRRLVTQAALPARAQREIMSLEDFKEASDKETGAFRGLVTGVHVAPRNRIAAVDDALEHFHKNRFVDEDAETVDMDTEENALRATNDVDNLVRLQDAVNAYINAAGEDSRGGVVALRSEIATELERYSRITNVDITARRSVLAESVDGDLNAVLAKARYLLDLAAPTEGSSASLELAVKIPIPHTPAFLGGSLSFEAEREDGLNVTCKVGLIGGVDVIFGKFKGSLGGYIDAKGKDSEQVVKLLNYGLYNRFRESKVVPAQLTNLLWGKKADTEGQQAAERWAQGVESETWSATKEMYALIAEIEKLGLEQAEALEADDQQRASSLHTEKERIKTRLDAVALEAAEETGYVETGGYLGAEAEFGIKGFGSAGVSAGYSSGRKLTGRGVAASKGIGESRTGKFTEAKVGQGVRKFTISGGVAAGGILAGDVTLGLAWESDRSGAMKFKNVTLDLSAAGKMPADALVGGGIGPAIIALLEKAVAIKELMAAKVPEGDMSTEEKVKVTGAVMSHLEGFGLLAGQLSSKEAFVPEFTVPQEATGTSVEGSVGLKLAVGFDFMDEKKATITLSYVKGFGISSPVLEIELERAKILFSKEISLPGSTETPSESD